MMAFERAYEVMARMRAVEQAQVRLWNDGLVPGELHTGIGEEGIIAGVLGRLTADDALALDHRGTSALIGRGADPEALLLEITGHPDGMNGGRGGHMHLFAPQLRASTDGMVGSAGPLACGLAIAAERLRPGSVAVAFFGDGAMNQGYLLESLNLAVAWRLPVLFVCKDNRWAITTPSSEVTGGKLLERARGFGLTAVKVNGGRIDRVGSCAGRMIARARKGRGPGFLLASCYRPGGHFTTDVLLRLLRDPRREAPEIVLPLLEALRGSGGDARQRAAALATLTARLGAFGAHHLRPARDPVAYARRQIDAATASRIDERVSADIARAEQSVRLRLASAADGAAPVKRTHAQASNGSGDPRPLRLTGAETLETGRGPA